MDGGTCVSNRFLKHVNGQSGGIWSSTAAE